MHRPLVRYVLSLSVGLALVAACAQAEPQTIAPTTTVSTTSTTSTTTTTRPLPTTTTADPLLIPVEDGWTLTATPHGSVQGYDGPDGAKTGEVTNTYYGFETTLPVIDQRPGWLHVRLAPKPNGSTSWVRVEDVDIGKTPWKIVVNLATTRLQLYKAGELMLDAPVGIGVDATPTVTGDFFVTFLQAPKNAGYGPFVMITSGHSEVLLTWEGFPDGILGLHGPVGADAQIGTTGAKISNGCIRMHVADQQQLADVQPGSPFQIIAG